MNLLKAGAGGNKMREENSDSKAWNQAPITYTTCYIRKRGVSSQVGRFFIRQTG
eukprot:c13541_g1_i1 orf=1-159(-)